MTFKKICDKKKGYGFSLFYTDVYKKEEIRPYFSSMLRCNKFSHFEHIINHLYSLSRAHNTILLKNFFKTEFFNKENLKALYDFSKKFAIDLGIVCPKDSKSRILDPYINNIYIRDGSSYRSKSLCDCGAKHTRNPNFHADWCSSNN